MNGTYTMAANVTSSLSDITVIGEGRNKSIIATNGFTVTLTGNNVTVQNLGVTSASSGSAAWHMGGTTNGLVTGCNFTDNGAASAFRFGDQSITTDCHFTANASTTELSLGGAIGVFSNNYIERTVAAGNTTGDIAMSGGKWTFTGNVYNNSSGASNAGRYILAVTNVDSIINGNIFLGSGSSQAGIRLDSNDCIVTGNNIKNCTTNYILINTGATSNRVYGNNLHGGTVTDNGTTSIVASAAN